jgi:hypothetical protein
LEEKWALVHPKTGLYYDPKTGESYYLPEIEDPIPVPVPVPEDEPV